jgi:hypothetical protein
MDSRLDHFHFHYLYFPNGVIPAYYLAFAGRQIEL